MNILTFDIEEWFHLLDNDSTRSEEQWKGFEVRIYENMERIFRILEETDTKATFFVIGWIAKTYPDIVRQIASKYQVGSHTMNHQLVWQQSREAFKEDVSSSIKLLEDITGQISLGILISCRSLCRIRLRRSEVGTIGPCVQTI